MIRYHEIDGLLCPLIFCEWCNARITDAADANVLFYGGWQTVSDDAPRIICVHKKCNHAVDMDDDREGRPHRMWEPLGVFLIQLGYNTSLWTIPESEEMIKQEQEHRIDRHKKVKLPKSEKVRSLTSRFAILKRDGYRCQLCGRMASDGVKLEVDHKIPRSKGGPDTVDNKWTLCFDCNRGKRTSLIGPDLYRHYDD